MGSKMEDGVFTLRDLARISEISVGPYESKEDRLSILQTAGNSPRFYRYNSANNSYDDFILLPTLCTEAAWTNGSAYKKTVSGYRKQINKMIQKHGPDSVVRVNRDSSGHLDGNQWVLSEKGGSLCESNKGGQVGPSVANGEPMPGNGGYMHSRRPTSGLSDVLQRMGMSYTPSMGTNGLSVPSNDQPGDRVGTQHSSREAQGRGPATGGEDQQRTPNGTWANVSPSAVGGDAGRAVPRPMTAKTVTTGDKHGVGGHAATQYRGTGRPVGTLERGLETKTPLKGSAGDVASPSSYLPPKPGASGSGYAGLGSRSYESDSIWSWGGGSLFDGIKAFKGTSYFNSYSYKGGVGSTYKSLLGLGRSVLGKITSKAEWSTEGSGISTEDRWRAANPGGAVNALEAKMKSKQLKKHAASIRKHMEQFLTAMEVGSGLNYSPRMSGKKLIKELVGKSYRLSRCQRDEMQTGLKLILVDISPSCEAIRDACYAAALAIAEADKDAVVVCHYNGYTAIDCTETGPGGLEMGCLIAGHRQSEIPHLSPRVDEELEKWASTANISGVIAFGDGDAAGLYALMAKYMPMVWLFPEGEEYAKQLLERHQPKETLDRNARLWIVSEVNDARTCVEGLRRISKGEK